MEALCPLLSSSGDNWDQMGRAELTALPIQPC